MIIRTSSFKFLMMPMFSPRKKYREQTLLLETNLSAVPLYLRDDALHSYAYGVTHITGAHRIRILLLTFPGSAHRRTSFSSDESRSQLLTASLWRPTEKYFSCSMPLLNIRSFLLNKICKNTGFVNPGVFYITAFSNVSLTYSFSDIWHAVAWITSCL